MFKDLLVIDTIRGGDSTGFIGVDGDDVVTAKKAIDGYGFTSMSLFSKQMTALTNATALIGHNRWATKGKVTDGNAHPFKRNNTYLVHNGSLNVGWDYGKSGLHDSNMTDVDSEAICFNVEEHGLRSTVEELDGAFALAVYDDILGIVSFVRNDDRPLYFATVKGKDLMIFASEAGMITLAATKHHVTLECDPWMLKTGCIMSFDVKAKGKVLATQEIEDNIPLYVRPTYQNNWGRGKAAKTIGGTTQLTRPSTDKAGTSNVLVLPKKERKKTTLADFKLNKFDKLMFVPTKFTAYKTSTSGAGAIKGDLYGDILDPIKIGTAFMYTINNTTFDRVKGKLVEVRPQSITYTEGIEQGGYPCVNYLKTLEDADACDYWKAFGDTAFMDSIEEEEEGESLTPFRGHDGVRVNASVFSRLTIGGCCMCLDPIPVDKEESEKIAWIGDKQPVCSSCTDLYTKYAIEADETLEDYLFGGTI